MPTSLPSLQYLLALSDESSWADLLATVIMADPGPIAAHLGLANTDRVQVRRDFPIGRGRSIDIVVTDGGRPVVAIETSVMEDLDSRLLDAVDAEFPEECRRGIIRLGSLPATLPDETRWTDRTWEDVLESHEASANPWVSITARAWREHIDTALPFADGDTTWSGVALEDSPVAALRVRAAWLAASLHDEADRRGVRVRTTSGRSGKRWGLEMWRRTDDPQYDIVVYLHERTKSEEIPDAGGTLFIPRGPEALVALRHRGAATSEDYDWAHLMELAPLYEAAPHEWFTARKPSPVGVDRDRYHDMVDAGAPAYLGFGVGDEPTFHTDDIAFGAKLTFRPDVTLATLNRELTALLDTVVALADAPLFSNGTTLG